MQRTAKSLKKLFSGAWFSVWQVSHCKRSSAEAGFYFLPLKLGWQPLRRSEAHAAPPPVPSLPLASFRWGCTPSPPRLERFRLKAYLRGFISILLGTGPTILAQKWRAHKTGQRVFKRPTPGFEGKPKGRSLKQQFERV